MAYTQFDTTKPDGFYVQIVRVIEPDPYAEHDFDEMSVERRNALHRDEWQYVGVRARARCCVIKNGVGTLFTIDSPGLWVVESDAKQEYIDEVYSTEVAKMKEMIAAMHSPVTYEEA